MIAEITPLTPGLGLVLALVYSVGSAVILSMAFKSDYSIFRTLLAERKIVKDGNWGIRIIMYPIFLALFTWSTYKSVQIFWLLFFS